LMTSKPCRAMARAMSATMTVAEGWTPTTLSATFGPGLIVKFTVDVYLSTIRAHACHISLEMGRGV